MLSNKPYLIRAFYDWIVDSQCTPFMVINANFPRSKIPQEYVEEGQITLNVSPEAIRELKIGNDFLDFRASFSGVVHIITAPIKAVVAIYAQENGQGMYFDLEEEVVDTTGNPWDNSVTETVPHEQETTFAQPKNNKKRPSHLKLVE